MHKFNQQNRKQQKEFQFNFPLTHEVVKDLRIVTEHVGDLQIIGVGYFDSNVTRMESDRYAVDIDFVKWNGTDIKPVLHVIGYLEYLEEVALAHVSGLFEEEETPIAAPRSFDEWFDEWGDIMLDNTNSKTN